MRTILIGNGPSAIQRRLGSEIDAYDCVIRINRCKTEGFEEMIGARTDIWVVNIAYTWGAITWPNRIPQPRTIVMCHSWDYDRFAKQISDSGAKQIPYKIAVEAECFCDAGYFSSCGALAAFMFQPCDILGFDHWQLGNHYGDNLPNPCSHNPVFEKAIFAWMELNGMVRRI